MKKLLKQLGFKHVTGNLWTHPRAPMMPFDVDGSIEFEIVNKLLERGKQIKIEEIKSILEIK